ncbi:hypothetical protein CH63R_03009 [Colletotrichum higginsianum IMI 349063]|uniref:Uncharacterized protein n=1 Tax=Colletotrichum higginsianum (strain IMI 349063) TaxID=759273 RepID=A0A1B7YQJ6_COLHI|nr:hypothetical protein CH63R_03009 [Colletotrichum higginsianum IMI 349063]OBR14283.1 hypothetical protein CH63R_03009 [Colletotrichum higginsianum IMI 349063]
MLQGMLANWVATHHTGSIKDVFHKGRAHEKEPDTVEEAVLQTLINLPEPPMMSEIHGVVTDARLKAYDNAIRMEREDSGKKHDDFVVFSDALESSVLHLQPRACNTSLSVSSFRQL